MVSIRPATADDAESVDAIAQAAFAHYTVRIGRPAVPMSVDYAAAIEAGKVWVAGERRTDGFVLLENTDDSLLLDVIAVAPAAQGSGVGKALLGFVDAEAHARGYTRVTLYTNVKMTENLTYYPRHGYVETGRESKHGFERVFFAKDLGGSDDAGGFYSA
jgi:ribosomal protein S18 acetylase RimI-like enzyme